MRKLLVIAAITAATLAPANAAFIDFIAEADGPNGERGVTSGSFITIDGVSLQLAADFDFGGPNARSINPYFDAGNAGLGACQALDADRQCAPSNDDNVTEQENLTIFFREFGAQNLNSFDILSFEFRDAGHNIIDANNDGLVTIDNFKGMVRTELFTTFIAMAEMGDDFFQNVGALRLFYENKEFYLSTMTINDMPIPGAIPLLISGLAGLGFASRRRRKT